MNTYHFSPERLLKIRRLRKARRLFKQEPLFAYYLMCKEYAGYTLAEFQDDLRRRTKKKKRFKKSSLSRYGRYNRIQDLISRYQYSKDEAVILKAMTLRKHITRPYRVMVRLKDLCFEYSFSPLIPIARIEELVLRFNACKTKAEIESTYQEFDANTISI